MGPLLLLPLLLLQGAPLDVRTSVDRGRVAVGEEVLFTLTASGRSTAAFRADVPPIDGFALIERRERTDVIPAGGQVTRVFTLEIQLRAFWRAWRDWMTGRLDPAGRPAAAAAAR